MSLPRYCPKEHALLWSAFSESLLSSWQLIVSTLSSSFDILDMLMPLLTQYFARVQASLLVGPAAATAVKAAKTGDANFMDFSELPSGASEAVVEIAVHYQPVYVDVLIALTEQLVTATRSSVAVAFLQDVWKWLATFTSSRAHPQQAVVQAKKDLAVQNATAIPVSSEDVEPPKIATVTHEIHANMVLLQSIARMTVVAQQHHLHTASVPVILGTSSPEDAAKVFRFLLCF